MPPENDRLFPPATQTPQLELVSILQAVARPLAVPQGTVLFRQGQHPSGAYVVQKGLIRLSLRCGSGEVAYKIVGPGCILGLPATVSGQPYSLTAEAVEDSGLACVEQQSLMDLLRDRSDLLMYVIATLAEELQQMRRQASLLAAEAHARSKRPRHSNLP